MSISHSRAWGVVRWIYRQLTATLSWPIDLTLGARTARFEPFSNLFGNDRRLHQSRSSTWLTLLRTFRRLGIQPDDALIDIGCGSGRVVVAATLLPFRRVIGVELDPVLCEQARRNLAGLRFGSKGRSEIIQGDAVAFGVPDDITIVYLANPFHGKVFQDFIEQVLGSLDRAPRRLRLVYFNPIEDRYLAATGRFRMIESFGGWRPDAAWRRSLTTHVYEVQFSPSRRVERTLGAPMAIADGAA